MSDSDEDLTKLKRRPRKKKQADQFSDEDDSSAIELATINLDLLSLDDFMKAYEKRPKPLSMRGVAKSLSGHLPTWGELESSSEPYPYTRMLQRAKRLARERNPEPDFPGDSLISIVAPKLQKDGPRKTVFTNFHDVCVSMSRTEEGVMDYLMKELSTTGNLDSNQCLILKGSYRDNNIEKALRKYVDEFVMCHACSSGNTTLVKDQNTRLHELRCLKCNAARNVQSASAGFAAQTTRRAALRAKQL
ncbi:eukaryotic translation initiation factor 2 beta [Perkinsela sp. CCAP 1560/4]|nr:eukaryotic translation initiation factor 2 beta [Perkinsela sp. CCAP 1560/4]|eukprot:KNH03819.1 eukaryotic translation initiation factor 2 beta [Perkinsela sp. CCAP 1560/4]